MGSPAPSPNRRSLRRRPGTGKNVSACSSACGGPSASAATRSRRRGRSATRALISTFLAIRRGGATRTSAPPHRIVDGEAPAPLGLPAHPPHGLARPLGRAPLRAGGGGPPLGVHQRGDGAPPPR